jgi:hypothetical protein
MSIGAKIEMVFLLGRESFSDKNRNSVMARLVDVTIWGWSELGFFWGSVGHVMLTEVDSTNVILSQFPHAPGQPTAPRGPNTLFSFPETTNAENRPSGIVFRVQVTDETNFDAVAANHRDRPIWDWDPTPLTQTHCARSSYDALRAGGINLDPTGRYVIVPGQTNQIIPDSLWALLKSVPGIVVVRQTAEVLPVGERVPYEADISRYVPFSAWHRENLSR